MMHKLIQIKKSIIIKLIFLIFIIATVVIAVLLIFSNLFLENPAYSHSHQGLFLWLIVFVIVIFFVAILVMHHYLKPIYDLTKAVGEIRKGNLEVLIPVKSKDELGELAEAYNKMTKDIKRMIKSKEQLLFDVSHELRTPLTNCKLGLEMMPDSKEKFSVLEDINEIENMINVMLETARMNSSAYEVNRKDLIVNDLLSNTIDKYFHSSPRIKTSPVAREIKISADERKIETVIKNIIENSLKYSSTNKPILIDVIDQEKKIIIQFEDSGPGIPDDKIEFIFEPFYKLDDSRSNKNDGYGLGLNICKKIMDLHEADLIVSNKQEGSGLITKMVFYKICKA